MGIKIKDNWDKISLEDYIYIQSVLLDDKLDEFEKEVKILCLLYGVQEDYFNEYTLEGIGKEFSALEFINTEPKGDIQDLYYVGGKEYRLTKTIKDLKASQFKDLNNFIKDSDEIINNLDKICGVLLLPTYKLSPFKRLFNRLLRIVNSHPKGRKMMEKRGIKSFLPDTEKYLQTDPQETSENIFHNLTVTQAMGICQFFFVLSNLYIECLANYSETKMMEELKSVYQSLKNEPTLKDRQEMNLIEMNLKKLTDLESIGDGLA